MTHHLMTLAIKIFQAKQKRSARKGKERAREERADSMMLEKTQAESILNELSEDQSSSLIDKAEMAGDVSDASDVDEREAHADLDEQDSCLDVEKSNSPSLHDGSFSSLSESNPSVVLNGPHKKNSSSPVIKIMANLSTRYLFLAFSILTSYIFLYLMGFIMQRKVSAE